MPGNTITIQGTRGQNPYTYTLPDGADPNNLTGQYGNTIQNLLQHGQQNGNTDPNALTNANLPPWLSSQFTFGGGQPWAETAVPDSWQLNAINGTGMKDANGNTVYGVGNMMGQNEWKYFNDPSKIYYDPNLGWVTQDHNAVDWNAFGQGSWHSNDYITAAATIAGGYLGANAIAGTGPFAAGGTMGSGGGIDLSTDGGLPTAYGSDGTTIGLGTGTGGGSTSLTQLGINDTPLPTDFTTGPPPTMIDPQIPGGGFNLGNLGNIINNPIVRSVGGTLVNSILGGGHGGTGMPTGSGGNSGGNSGGFNLGNLLNTAGSYIGDQNLINTYQNMFNDMYNRGDYNSQYRPGQLNMLNQFLTDPSKALQDPGYQNMRQMQLDNESRSLAARGLNLSGNEMGDLMQYGTNLDYQHINDTENQLRSAAQLGNPDQMARMGIGSLPFMLGMMSNRNNDLSGNLGNLLFGGNGSNSGGLNLSSIIHSLTGGGGGNSWDNIDWNNPNNGTPSTTDPSTWTNGNTGGGFVDDPGFTAPDATGYGTDTSSWINDIFGP